MTLVAGIICCSTVSLQNAAAIRYLSSSNVGGAKVVQVSLGESHSAALKSDGTLWTWGSNGWGQLGDHTSGYRSVPAKVMDDVACVSAGGNTTAAVKTDGTLWTWGSNAGGLLCSGSEELFSFNPDPVKVMDEVSTVCIGSTSAAAVKTNGVLWMWGTNVYGQLGVGFADEAYYIRPTRVTENVASVALGDGWTAAVKTDGTLWAWGDNSWGQLGDGTTEDSYEPIEIMEDVASVALGSDFSAAVKTDGTLWTWGQNDYGKLGNGSCGHWDGRPTKIMDGVSSAYAGFIHSVAVRADGTLWAWGWNGNGRLGDGTTEERHSPVEIISGVSLPAIDEQGNDDVYAILYTDGTLVIQNGTSRDAGKTVDEQWTGFAASKKVPWHGRAGSVKSVEVRGDVKPASTSRWFSDMAGCTSIDLSGLDTSRVTDMSSMFFTCRSLESIDVTDFDTSNVTDMSCMFIGCSALETLDVSGFDTRNVTNMNSMFGHCKSLRTLDVSGFDTSNVTDMAYMFSFCSAVETLDVSRFDTSKVINTSSMFNGCSAVGCLNVSGFSMSSVWDMENMFSDCSFLKNLDVSGFDTSSAEMTCYMFSGCSSLRSLDLSRFDMSNVRNSEGMLYGCNSLEKVSVGRKGSFAGLLPEGRNAKGDVVLWYDELGNPFTPDAVPNRVAAVYTRSFYSSEFAQVDGAWHWFDENGGDTGAVGVAVGLVSRGGFVYFLKADGTFAASDWVDADGARRYFGEDGRMATGWQRIDGATYYLGNDGGMATGWTSVDGEMHYFGEDGVNDPSAVYAGTSAERSPISKAKATLSAASYAYDGKAKRPAVTVKAGGRTLEKGTDYAVAYKNNVKVGTATITIKGIGAYAGTKTATFKINPKGTKVTKLSKAKKAFTVKWKKQAAQTTGYQVCYSTSKSMKAAVTKTVKGSSKTSLKVTKLKAGKKYYVQVRTYKTVGGVKYYSSWSSKKTVTTK